MKKLSLLFVFVLVLVAVLAFSASAKNITKEAEFSMASGGDLCQSEYVIDDNYHTGASNGNIQKWCDYYFEFDTPKNVTKIRVICNSIGENMGVCTFDTISNYSNGVICRVKAGNTSLVDVTIQTSKATPVYNADGEVIYTYIDFVPSDGTSWKNVTWINIPALHEKQKETCLWEIDIFDDQECTDDTHEFVCDDCNTVLKCNACGLEKEETSHPYLAATCVELSKCVVCSATTGELSTEHDFAPATCAAPMTCKLCNITVGEVADEHTSVPADDGDCTTPVVCNTCKQDAIPAYIHRYSIDAISCLNDGCRRSIWDENISKQAKVTYTPDDAAFWAYNPNYFTDGNWGSASYAPKTSWRAVNNFTYIFTYEEAQYVTRFVVAVNGDRFSTPNGTVNGNNAIKNVTVRLYNEVDGEKVLVYESDRCDFSANANEAILELPYAIQATEATFEFNSSEGWGSSFVREIEIYRPYSLENNIASAGNPTASPTGGAYDFWACNPEYIIDGDKSTATHSPKNTNFAYTFEYENEQLISKVVVVANGECKTLQPNAAGDQNSSAIKNVTIALYNKAGNLVYESDRYDFTDDVTEITIQLPYTYYATKVVATFNSSQQYGSSFVREIEIYETLLPNFPEGGVELDKVDFDGCWKKIKVKDALSEVLYNDPDHSYSGRSDSFIFLRDEDGNLILDEKGNAIYYTGALIGGNTNPYGTEMDGIDTTGIGIYFEGQKNSIQYNFNKTYLITQINISFIAGSNSEDGYDLWVGNVIDGVEVWEQVVAYYASGSGLNKSTFTLGEDGEGVEGSMVRFCWRPGKTPRLTPSLTEIDFTLYENRCDWVENDVLVEGNCGYDRVAECECARCGLEKNVVTPASGEHNKSVKEEAKAATCVDFGLNAVKYCATCEKTFGGDRIEKPLEHDMSVAATCTTAKSCSRCDHTEGNPLGHKEGTKATCTDAAICSVCNESYGDPLGHKEETVKGTAATCTTAGMTDGVICSVCEAVLTEQTEIIAKGHRYANLSVTSATCTEDGYFTVACGDCDVVIDSRVEADAEAIQEYLDNLGPYINIDVAAKGHTEGTAATCTSKAVCSVCEEEYGDYKHNYAYFSAYHEETTVTCTEDGVGVMFCDDCYESYILVEMKAGHRWALETIEPATCQEAGYGKYCCQACGIYDEERGEIEIEVDPTAHDNDWAKYEYVPSTCQTPGYEKNVCSLCNKEQIEEYELDEFNHEWNNFTVDGTVINYVCNCGETKTENTLAVGDNAIEFEWVEFWYGSTYDNYLVTIVVPGKYTIISSDAVAAVVGKYYDEPIELPYSFEIKEGESITFAFTSLNVLEQGTATVTLTKAPDHVHVEEEIPAVLPLPSTEHKGSTAGVKCADCGAIIVAPVEFTAGTSADGKFKINSATLALGEDISVVYDATHPTNGSDEGMYMVFILNGKETVIEKKSSVSGNRYSFKFTGMRAQYMSDNIEAYVYAIEDGNYVMKSHLQYSVKQYCVNQLKKSETSNRDRNIIYAVLNLGDCVQKFANSSISEDKLITKIVAREVGFEIPATSVDTVDYTSVQAVTGDRTKGYDWKSGALSMGNAVKLSLDFTADELEGLVLVFDIGGNRTIEIDASEATEVKGYTNRYNIEFQVKVLEYAETITCTFVKNGESVGSTLTYSVYTYIVRCYQDTKYSEIQRNFMKAIYAYGQAVKAGN